MSEPVLGGPIQPVKVITDSDLEAGGVRYVISGRVARRVYRFTTEQRSIIAGPLKPVYVVTQAQLDSGAFRLMGNTALEPIAYSDDVGADDRAATGEIALPVFVVEQE